MKPKRPNFFMHLHFPKIPEREGSFFYTFGLGGISLFLILVLIITGLLEVFYYVPSMEEANRSLQVITYLVPYGNLIRGIHYWAGQLLVGTTILHLLRVVLTGSYKPPRRTNWLIGIALLLLVLFSNFTGYGLRWDKDIAWALLVGTNLIKQIPWIGEGLYTILVGGSTIGELTIVRFYAWHIYGLALLAVIFTVWHIFRVRRDGGVATKQNSNPHPKISRALLNEKEIAAILAVSIVLVVLALLFPPGLESPADFENIPDHPTAPWFFIWVQQLLLSGDARLMGVVIPLAILILLTVVPFLLDKSDSGVAVWFNQEGRLAQIIVLLIITGLVGLTLVKVL